MIENNHFGKVYHYTTIEAFLSIIKHGELWASNARFMNDKSEFEFGLSKINEVLNEVINDSDIEIDRRDLLQNIREILSRKIFDYPFVISFSKEPDVLSMWRSYGQDICVCLEFENICYPSPNGMIIPKSIIYELERQKELLVNSLKGAIRQVKSSAISEFLIKNQFSEDQYCLRTLLIDSLFIKNASFQEEKEVRLSFDLSHLIMFKRDYRISRFGIVPYLRVKFDENRLRRVIVGPHHDVENIRIGITDFLKSAGFSHVAVDVSEIPLRT